ncbi:Cof-type HAD-IIB family hydrolase (plasmid) [Deinococcus taeanensis]|uniref:HAD family hydrolase n=1 Tax=Deinococcus taeanensis TaxID=2737050 RepID=UPI001CDBB032|nr:HAD family hydrolase [Deinococcus taeanensis]UBV45233.1 Cof-type HAD-IIB family hydrolase [Deinococcus taeanensis]
MRRLLALDLDGTLLRSDGTLGCRTRAALGQAQRLDWVVFPVTARPTRTVLPLAQQEGWPEAACCNGAVVVAIDGTVLTSTPLERPSVTAFMGAARAQLPGIAFAAEWGTHLRAEPRYAALRHGAQAPRSEAPAPFRLVPDGPAPLKIMVRHPRWSGPELSERLGPLTPPLGLSVTCSATGFAELTDGRASKVRATQEACRRHGIDQHSVVAFGDMPADADLLQWAGHGVAVGNAHPHVLGVADEVTATNDEEGVAQVIERLMWSEGPHQAGGAQR